MAERQGFEPWVPFIAGHSLSRRAPSAYSVTSPWHKYTDSTRKNQFKLSAGFSMLFCNGLCAVTDPLMFHLPSGTWQGLDGEGAWYGIKPLSPQRE